MTGYVVICPQCQGAFEWADGFPDLYGIRLCWITCRDVWLREHEYRGVPDTQEAQFAESDPARQMIDGLPRSPQASEVAPRRRRESQME